MRLVSQDGMNGIYDIPYEKCLVYIYGDKKTIKVQPLGEVDSEYVFATYSTEDKALKVMEMLRNSYCGLPIIMKNVDISDEVIELLKDLNKNGIIFQEVEENPSVEYVDNTYFKFPADEEIEV